ncbi:MAG: hypothetical protein OXS28_15260 [Gammaproteobacteria bacterium]|nr:hypothetical protein [Gammaproteobacteria bacterium]
MTEKPKTVMHGEPTETRKGRTSTEDKAKKCGTQWPWPAQMLFALVIIIAVVVLLVGLPTASLLVTERMFPISDSVSLRGMVSFWGAMFAAFISLAVLFIGAVFAFTALRVESGAQFEARKAAEEGVIDGLKRTKKDIADVESRIRALRDRISDKADAIIKEKADAFIDENGKKIAKDMSYDYVYTKDNGARITRDMAKGYICDKDNGAQITRDVARNYVNDNGAGITREVVEKYAREDIDGAEMTRLEKITGETVEKISAEHITGLIDERLSSLGFFEKFQVLFLRRRPDGSDSPDEGRH